MQIYVAKSGQRIGPFSEEQIQSMLNSDMVTLTDSAWHDGLPSWLPLHQVLNINLPPPPKPASFLKQKLPSNIFISIRSREDALGIVAAAVFVFTLLAVQFLASALLTPASLVYAIYAIVSGLGALFLGLFKSRITAILLLLAICLVVLIDISSGAMRLYFSSGSYVTIAISLGLVILSVRVTEATFKLHGIFATRRT